MAQLSISKGSCEFFSNNHLARRRGCGRGENFEDLVVEAWEIMRLVGGLVRTSLDLTWRFLPGCGFGLTKGFGVGS